MYTLFSITKEYIQAFENEHWNVCSFLHHIRRAKIENFKLFSENSLRRFKSKETVFFLKSHFNNIHTKFSLLIERHHIILHHIEVITL